MTQESQGEHAAALFNQQTNDDLYAGVAEVVLRDQAGNVVSGSVEIAQAAPVPRDPAFGSLPQAVIDSLSERQKEILRGTVRPAFVDRAPVLNSKSEHIESGKTAGVSLESVIDQLEREKLTKQADHDPYVEERKQFGINPADPRAVDPETLQAWRDEHQTNAADPTPHVTAITIDELRQTADRLTEELRTARVAAEIAGQQVIACEVEKQKYAAALRAIIDDPVPNLTHVKIAREALGWDK